MFSQESELDAEIRRLISLLTKQHIRSWYTNISQDEELFTHFNELTSRIQNTLSGRAQAIDWQEFFIYQLPEMLLRHLEDFNLANERTRHGTALDDSFFALQSHPGIADQSTYITNVADALLIVLLPENDLMCDLAYAFVRELLSDLVFSTVIERLSEPWFWDELLLKLYDHACKESLRNQFRWQSQCRLYCRAIPSQLWSCVKGVYTRFSCQKAQDRSAADQPDLVQLVTNLFYSPFSWRLNGLSLYNTAIPKLLEELAAPSDWSFAKAVLHALILPVVDIFAGEKIIGKLNDQLESSLSSASLAKMTRLARNVLFPNDEPSPNRIIPSVEEQVDLHLRLEAALPAGIHIPFFASKNINKVLLFQILDALLGTIFPELQRRSPEQLKEKVIRIRQANMEATGDGGISTGRSPRYRESPMELGPHSAPTAAARAEWNLKMFEADREGIEALQAMKRSFDLKRRQDTVFGMTSP